MSRSLAPEWPVSHTVTMHHASPPEPKPGGQSNIPPDGVTSANLSAGDSAEDGQTGRPRGERWDRNDDVISSMGYLREIRPHGEERDRPRSDEMDDCHRADCPWLRNMADDIGSLWTGR